MRKFHYLYKITNNINGKYYIGRHSTDNLDDSYYGSGVGIVNAITKYGKENFSKEILHQCETTEELWELEKKVVNADVVKDKNSYNMAFGGGNHLKEMKQNDYESFISHQSKAGKLGGQAMSKKVGKDWHAKGGAKSRSILNAQFIYQLITPENETIELPALEIKNYCIEHNLNYQSLISNQNKKLSKGASAGYTLINISRPYEVNVDKKIFTQNAFNRPRYICPICEKNNLDGGNLSQHMNKKHQWTKEQVIEYKNNFTLKTDETNK
jgi:hypothetical protein